METPAAPSPPRRERPTRPQLRRRHGRDVRETAARNAMAARRPLLRFSGGRVMPLPSATSSALSAMWPTKVQPHARRVRRRHGRRFAIDGQGRTAPTPVLRPRRVVAGGDGDGACVRTAGIRRARVQRRRPVAGQCRHGDPAPPRRLPGAGHAGAGERRPGAGPDAGQPSPAGCRRSCPRLRRHRPGPATANRLTTPPTVSAGPSSSVRIVTHAQVAGLRSNPGFQGQVENIAGSGPFRGLRSAGTAVGASIPIELDGKRGRRCNHGARATAGGDRRRRRPPPCDAALRPGGRGRSVGNAACPP